MCVDGSALIIEMTSFDHYEGSRPIVRAGSEIQYLGTSTSLRYQARGKRSDAPTGSREKGSTGF